MQVTLFHLEREDITIDIKARFDQDAPVIDGFDFGKTVKKFRGNDDYEYSLRIGPQEIDRLYDYLAIVQGDKQAILNALACSYNTNYSLSRIGKNGGKPENS